MECREGGMMSCMEAAAVETQVGPEGGASVRKASWNQQDSSNRPPSTAPGLCGSSLITRATLALVFGFGLFLAQYGKVPEHRHSVIFFDNHLTPGT